MKSDRAYMGTIQIKPSLSVRHWPQVVFVLCWLAYASAYFCRVNISVAMPAIQESFGWSKVQLGLIGSCFFWVYGVGQLINGYIGDKISGRLFIFAGLVVSALVNIVFGFTSSLLVMTLLWSINGYSLSMLWGPIVRMLSIWFPKKDNTRVSVGISTSMIGGFILAWGGAGQILVRLNWSWLFWIPGIVVLIYAFVWFVGMDLVYKDNVSQSFLRPTRNENANIQIKNRSILKFITNEKLWLVAIACVTQGVIKDGISLWGPVFLMESQNLDITSVTGYLFLIPIINFCGILLSGWINKKFKYQDRLTVAIFFTGSIVAILGLFLLASISVYLSVFLLSCCSALMYGANTLLVSVIPMGFDKHNKVSTVAARLSQTS